MIRVISGCHWTRASNSLKKYICMLSVTEKFIFFRHFFLSWRINNSKRSNDKSYKLLCVFRSHENGKKGYLQNNTKELYHNVALISHRYTHKFHANFRKMNVSSIISFKTKATLCFVDTFLWQMSCAEVCSWRTHAEYEWVNEYVCDVVPSANNIHDNIPPPNICDAFLIFVGWLRDANRYHWYDIT